MACLSNGDHASMVDARLYLAIDWCDDPMRCQETEIPEISRAFKTKLDIGYDILLDQQELGTLFYLIGADGYYGNNINF
jgi:hypothetical protein